MSESAADPLAGAHGSAVYRLKTAIEYMRTSRFDEAQRELDAVLRKYPDHADALALDGQLCVLGGDDAGACQRFQRALAQRPQDRGLCLAFSESAIASGNWQEAESYLVEWLRAEGNDAEAHYLLGEARRASGDVYGAIAAYCDAVDRNPKFILARANLAAALIQVGRPEDALPHCRAGLAADDSLAGLHFNFGKALEACGALGEAVTAFQRAVERDPGFVAARNDLGHLLHLGGEIDAASHHLREAVRLAPDFALAHANLGTVLKDQGDVRVASAAAAEAVRIDPYCAQGWSNLFVTQAYLGVDGRTRQAVAARAHFDSLFRDGAPRHVAGISPTVAKRLRVGYLSADLCDHAVSYFLEPVLEHHDRERFEIFCYDLNAVPDAVSARLKTTVTQWRTCAHLADEDIANWVVRDDIDILVDLMGHTAANRFRVFALHPAPMQVSWLGWPSSTGLSAIRYRLCDPHITEGADADTGPEALLPLPHTWLCYRPPAIAPDVSFMARASSRAVTFGSFNSVFKLGGQVIATWSRILESLRGSRLLIVGVPAGHAQRRLMDAFLAERIDPSRVEIQPPCSLEQFLSLHARVDVALDPFPFNGSTTTLHSMWMGVPVLTLAGATHAGRMGCSIMRNLGLDRHIACDEVEYIERAIAVATDQEYQLKMRSELRARMAASPLMDEAGFTRALECAYVGMRAAAA